MAENNGKIIKEQYFSKDNTFFTVAKTNPKDIVEKEIGDSKVPGQFIPQQKVTRWDNEVNVSVRLVQNEKSPTVIQDGDIIKWQGDKVEAHFYDIEHEGDSASEFEIILKEKPLSNVVEFSLVDKGVEYFYQPALTEKEIEDGAERPENVVGSYAVYASEQKTNWKGGKEYKCGKVGHIYRPQIVDAEGNTVWGDLHIENGILSVTIPQEFLDTAVYPVRHAAGLTFGYTSSGASTVTIAWLSGTTPWARRYGYGNQSIGEVGTLSKISAYLSANRNLSCDVSVFINEENSGGTGIHGQIATSEILDLSLTTTKTLTDFTANSENISDSTYIFSAFGNADDFSTSEDKAYCASDDTNNVNSYYEQELNYSKENPWTEIATANGDKLSIYATYTKSSTAAEIAVDATASNTGTKSDSTSPYTISWSHTVGTGDYRYLLVGLSYYHGVSRTINSVTYGGTALTLLESNTGISQKTLMYGLVAPNSGTENIVVTFSGALTSAEVSLASISFTGVDQINPINESVSGNSTSNSGYSASITTTIDDCYLVDAMCVEAVGSNNPAPNTGQTQIARNLDSIVDNGESYKAVTTAGSYNMGWTWSSLGSNAYSYSIVALTPAQPIHTFYFDGSDVAASDPDSVWTNETNADDGNDSTFATTSTQGTNSTNELVVEGTNADTTDDEITQVRARFYGKSGLNSNFSSCDITAEFFTNGRSESLGSVSISESGAGDWSEYIILDEPTGGWDSSTVQSLEVVSWQVGDGGMGGVSFSIAEIEVTRTLSVPAQTYNVTVDAKTNVSKTMSATVSAEASILKTIDKTVSATVRVTKVESANVSASVNIQAATSTESQTVSAKTRVELDLSGNIIFKDTFSVDANIEDIQLHTPDIGDSWELIHQTTTQCYLRVRTTDTARVYSSVQNGGFLYVANPENTPSINDYEISVDATAGFAGTNSLGIVFRYVDSDNFYLFVCYPGGTGTASIQKKQGGTWSTLSTIASNPAVGNNVRVDVVNNGFTVYYNNVVAAPTIFDTSGNVIESGIFGISMGGGSFFQNTGDDLFGDNQIDNFSVREIYSFGKNTVYGSGSTKNNQIRGCEGTPDFSGTVRSINAFISAFWSAGIKAKMILAEIDGTVIAETEERDCGSANGTWQKFYFQTPPEVTAGTQYLLGFFCDNDIAFRYASTGGLYEPNQNATYPTVPTTLTRSGSYQWSLYAEYEAVIPDTISVTVDSSVCVQKTISGTVSSVSRITVGGIAQTISAKVSIQKTVTIGPVPEEGIVDSYEDLDEEYSYNVIMGETVIARGTGFVGDGSTLTRFKFRMSKENTPPGNVYAKIYASSGTYGADAIPTGDALAVSEGVVASTLPLDIVNTAWIEFTFTGQNQITLEDGVEYFVVAEYSGGNANNFVRTTLASDGTGHASNLVQYTSSWSAYSNYDHLFIVYGSTLVGGQGLSSKASILSSASKQIDAKCNINATNTYSVSAKCSITSAGAVEITAKVNIQKGVSVALNSPTDGLETSNLNTVFEFTGTDDNGDDIRYNIQIDTVDTFDSISLIDSVSGTDDGFENIDTPADTDPFNSGDRMRFAIPDIVTTPSTISIYDESNASAITSLHATSSVKSIGQSFTGTGEKIGSIKFWGRKNGTPPGYTYAKIYAHAGTYGVNSSPTGSPLATSDGLLADSLSSSLDWNTYVFSGENKITLEDGVYYVLSISYTEGDSSNSMSIMHDWSSGTHSGNRFQYWNTSLQTASAEDLVHQVISAESSEPWLDYGTYYWRVRGIDPSGTNEYSEWTETSSVIIRTFSSTVSAKSCIQKTEIATSDAIVSIQKEFTQTVSAIVNIQNTEESTVSAVANVQSTKEASIENAKTRITVGGNAVSVSAKTSIFKQSTSSFYSVVSIKKEFDVTISSFANIQKTYQNTISSVLSTKKELQNTVSTKIRVQKTIENSVSSILSVQKTFVDAVESVVRIQKTELASIDTKARIKRIESAIVSATSNVQNTITKSILSSVNVQNTNESTVDTIIRVSVGGSSVAFTSRVSVFKEAEKTIASFVSIQKQFTSSISSAINVQKTIENIISSSIDVKKEISQSISSIIRIQKNYSYTVDTYISVLKSFSASVQSKVRILTENVTEISSKVDILKHKSVDVSSFVTIFKIGSPFVSAKISVLKASQSTITSKISVAKTVIISLNSKLSVVHTYLSEINTRVNIQSLRVVAISSRVCVAVLSIPKQISAKIRIIFEVGEITVNEIINNKAVFQKSITRIHKINTKTIRNNTFSKAIKRIHSVFVKSNRTSFVNVKEVMYYKDEKRAYVSAKVYITLS